MIILPGRLPTQLLCISSWYNFFRNSSSIILVTHLSNKNFSQDNIIEGKKIKKEKENTYFNRT